MIRLCRYVYHDGTYGHIELFKDPGPSIISPIQNNLEVMKHTFPSTLTEIIKYFAYYNIIYNHHTSQTINFGLLP